MGKSRKIFVSYSRIDFKTAEAIAVRASRYGYVFFDIDSLPKGAGFDELISQEIRRSDLFVFLISPDSIAEGSYSRTELRIARNHRPDPSGWVLPIMVRTTPVPELPAYLSAVSILKPEGNLVAEATAEIHRIIIGLDEMDKIQEVRQNNSSAASLTTILKEASEIEESVETDAPAQGSMPPFHHRASDLNLERLPRFPLYCPNCLSTIPENIESWICLRSVVSAKSTNERGTRMSHELRGRGAVESEACLEFNACNTICGRCKQERDLRHSSGSCPFCRFELTLADYAFSGCFAIAGPSFSGKTTFLITLNKWLLEHMHEFGVTIELVMSEESRRQSRNLENRLYIERQGPHATLTSEATPYSYRLRATKIPERSTLISMSDVSGEHLLTPRGVLASRHYHNVLGIAFLIDAESLVGSNYSAILQYRDIATEMISDLERRLGPTLSRGIPIAICVSKLDVFLSVDPEWVRATSCKGKTYTFNGESLTQRSDAIRKLLYRDRTVASVLYLIEERFSYVKFCAISALGTRASDVAPVDSKYIEDPILYLFWHLGLVDLEH